MKYICNDCSDGNDFAANCRLDLPTIAGKPKYCPIFDNNERCNWEEVKAPKEKFRMGRNDTMTTKNVNLEMGCLCPTFSEQLQKQGVKFNPETMVKYDKQLETLNGLKFDDLFQPNQINKAYDRLSKKVFEHIHSIANGE